MNLDLKSDVLHTYVLVNIDQPEMIATAKTFLTIQESITLNRAYAANQSSKRWIKQDA